MYHPTTRDAYPTRCGASGDALTGSTRMVEAEKLELQAGFCVAIGPRVVDVRPTAVGINATAAQGAS